MHAKLQEHFHNKFPGGLFSNSSNGWMDGTLFHSWLEFGFNEGITKCNVRKPVLLLIDGVRCHISIETLEFCATNDIILYILYPNATHLIQALDLVLMGIIKTAYKEEVWQWLIANLGEVFDKYIFIKVFMKVWDRAAKVEHAIRGFELSGIYPLNPAKVKMGKLAPSSLYTKQDQLPEIANESFMNEPEGIVEDANVAKIPQLDEAVTLMQPDGNGMKK